MDTQHRGRGVARTLVQVAYALQAVRGLPPVHGDGRRTELGEGWRQALSAALAAQLAPLSEVLPPMTPAGRAGWTRRRGAGGSTPSPQRVTSMSTLPVTPSSTAWWAAAVSASGKTCSGRPASSPTRTAPSRTAALTSSTAMSLARVGAV